jgi:hypothetical protein
MSAHRHRTGSHRSEPRTPPKRPRNHLLHRHEPSGSSELASMLKPPVPTSLASDAPPRPPGLRPPRRPWRMPLRRAGPARPGPVPRRWIFPRRPGRPRAGHPGSDPFGHRDRPDGLGTPLERVHQAAALLSGRTLAMVLAPSPPRWLPREPDGPCSSPWSGADPGSCPPRMPVSCCWTSPRRRGIWTPSRRPCSMSRRGLSASPARSFFAGDQRPVGQHAEPSLPCLRAPRADAMAALARIWQT